MVATYRIEDEQEEGFVLRRVIELNECQNMKCGCSVEVIQPMLLPSGAQ